MSRFKDSNRRLRRCSRVLGAALALPVLHASAGTTFDVIGPREYELPVDFKPFNVFVQYATLQNTDRTFDSDGNRADGSGTETISGLSKYVRFWTPDFNHRIGLAWEVIASEVSVRNHSANAADANQTSGIGDPLTGFALWYKPSDNSTFGIQSFVQMPVGNSDVSDTNWKNLTSLLWDVRLPAHLGWTADAGFVYQGRRTRDHLRPGMAWHTNQRFAWQATELLEPFVAVDAEYDDGHDGIASAWTVDAGPGVMFHTFDNQSITVRYATSVAGRNRDVNNSFNLKYAYVW
ncbi:transporter [Solimonas marina]|uniref:Transporter n=1 Tax=Solimonas marina TaxID=2714601 RepID=A0A970BBN3_9GAMM|nr:transporter [Solimonas marina]NKF24636.1 transporter [Solimonas marina]